MRVPKYYVEKEHYLRHKNIKIYMKQQKKKLFSLYVKLTNLLSL